MVAEVVRLTLVTGCTLGSVGCIAEFCWRKWAEWGVIVAEPEIHIRLCPVLEWSTIRGVAVS